MLQELLALTLLTMAIGAPAPVSAAGNFDPRNYQRQVVGGPTQVLVLGSPHISGAPEDFDPAVLEPLLDRLAAFKPGVIAIESLSGESIDALWRFREIYPKVASTYGRDAMTMASMLRHPLQLDTPAAEAQVRRTLAAWPAEPTAADRRRLAALLIAAGDVNSALVQWWRLPLAEQIAGNELDRQVVERLLAWSQGRNENQMIGSRLAVRLGLERVYPIDDHASDDVLLNRGEDLEKFLEQPWFAELLGDPRFAPLRDSSSKLTTPEQALETYRLLNSAQAMQLDADMQWLSMLRRPSPNHVGRTRVAEWETRNLRQVANIREVMAQHPGEHVLVITGSSHKAWFEAYLRLMIDVQVVDGEKVLH